MLGHIQTAKSATYLFYFQKNFLDKFVSSVIVQKSFAAKFQIYGGRLKSTIFHFTRSKNYASRESSKSTGLDSLNVKTVNTYNIETALHSEAEQSSPEVIEEWNK